MCRKNVIVTGATSGIGKAIALRLCSQDATVVAVGRNREALKDLTTPLGGG